VIEDKTLEHGVIKFGKRYRQMSSVPSLLFNIKKNLIQLKKRRGRYAAFLIKFIPRHRGNARLHS